MCQEDWDSLHAWLNRHCKPQSLENKAQKSTKRLKHTGNLFRKNQQLKGVC